MSKNLATSVAASSIANKARNKGALLSKASPVYDTKTVGIHKVVPKIKAGDVGSQAVYPRASKVFRIPPFGKEEASGSCCTNNDPLNFSTGSDPSNDVSKKASCFSAVVPVKG